MNPATKNQFDTVIRHLDMWGYMHRTHGLLVALGKGPVNADARLWESDVQAARKRWIASMTALDRGQVEQLTPAIEVWAESMYSAGWAGGMAYRSPDDMAAGREVIAADDVAQVARLAWLEPLLDAKRPPTEPGAENSD